MDAPGPVPDSINCHACGALIDLAGRAGFTHVECQRCDALSVVPLQFGEFLLLSPIGSGSIGTVYKSIDLSLNRYVALKILPRKLSAQPASVNNFSREARSAAVNHHNVAQVYTFGEHDGQYYIAMELLERGSLDDRITKLGKLPEPDVLSVGVQVASALKAAWGRGVLHRDVKPGNILFNEHEVPKLVDFGLARSHNTDEENPEHVWGTPYYIAPEKLRGQPEDFRSDIYSLGATLFHAAAGRPPFDAATTGEVITKHVTQPAALQTYAPTIHDRTTQVISCMLAKDPDDRYGSYDVLIEELAGAREDLNPKTVSTRRSMWNLLGLRSAEQPRV